MPERVKEQILEIRATGETNMFDLYAHFILTGEG